MKREKQKELYDITKLLLSPDVETIALGATLLNGTELIKNLSKHYISPASAYYSLPGFISEYPKHIQEYDSNHRYNIRAKNCNVKNLIYELINNKTVSLSETEVYGNVCLLLSILHYDLLSRRRSKNCCEAVKDACRGRDFQYVKHILRKSRSTKKYIIIRRKISEEKRQELQVLLNRDNYLKQKIWIQSNYMSRLSIF